MVSAHETDNLLDSKPSAEVTIANRCPKLYLTSLLLGPLGRTITITQDCLVNPTARPFITLSQILKQVCRTQTLL
jgi:hypothetical protein